MNNEPVVWTACLDCGKRVTGDSIHTCSPQLKKLTDNMTTWTTEDRKEASPPHIIDGGASHQTLGIEYKNVFKKEDLVNHPKHYTSHPSGVECIQVTEHMGFNLGNAMKYIWRADEKGNAVEDLRKAVWYINREIAKRIKV